MPKIYFAVMIGIPGAGKTTFCRNLIKNNRKFNITHVCFDEYIVNGKSEYQSYKEQRTALIMKINNLVDAIINNAEFPKCFAPEYLSPSNGDDFLILIDDNNYYKGMRYEFYKICKHFGLSFLQFYFKINLTEAIQRNNTRNCDEFIPAETIEKMQNKLETPTSISWETRTYVVDNKVVLDWNNIFDYVEQSPKVIASSRAEPVQFRQNEIHKADLELRKCVKSLITNYRARNGGVNVKYIAEKLNDKRKCLLQDLQTGILSLDDGHYFLDMLSCELQNEF